MQRLKDLSGRLSYLVKQRLWLQVLIGLAAGMLFGTLIGPDAGLTSAATRDTIADWIALPGHAFIGIVQMVVIPLIFASVVRGLNTMDLRQLRRVGGWAGLFFLGTTVLALAIGIASTWWLRPGDHIDPAMASAILGESTPTPTGSLSATELISDIIPSNPLSAMVNLQMLQVVLFAAIFGVAIAVMSRSSARPLLDLLAALQEACITIVRWAMVLAPYAVFGLIGSLVARLGLSVLAGMAFYVVTVVAGLAALMLAYLVIMRLAAGMSARRFLRASRDTLLLAFSTSSSAAVMPLTLRTADEGLGVHPALSRFIIPFGATVNMAGTALYQGAATVFLAQVFGIDLGWSEILLVVLTAVMASIGTPAAPGVGVVILSMVVGSVGIPVAGIALILGVDRILDMVRTAANVMGDLAAAVVVDHRIGDSLDGADVHVQAGPTTPA